ncbi:MAG TPA: bacterioferritin [Clostridiales bacterium]|nr:bacterioferritin [Clostridiales bacterium]
MTPTSNKVIYRGYSDSSPYPPIKVQAPNRDYADLLMDDLAGPSGEFTAMSLYFYQHSVADKQFGDYSIMTMRIAIAELHHMDILSSVIRELGGNPVFQSSTRSNARYWSAKNVVYSSDLCKSLRIALDGETNAIETYGRHIQMIDDPYLKNILERIVVDERLHRSYIYHMIEEYCR